MYCSRRLLTALILSLALPFSDLAGSARAQEVVTDTESSAITELAATIDAYLAEHHALDQLSGAVLVADAGRVVYRGAFGEAHSDWGIPNTIQTRFRIASVTKQFTAMATLLLVRDGELELDAPITRYLDGYPSDSGDKVTIRHLLRHTSGIPSYTDRPGFMERDAKERLSVEDFVATYCSDPLQFEPGTEFRYSNSGYFLLGAILEYVTGESYARVLQKRIFDPLGMSGSGVDDSSRVLPRRAQGYDDILGGRSVARWIDMSSPGAAGAMYSTVVDLLTWSCALSEGRLLDGDLAREMIVPGLAGYAFGWEIQELPGETGGSLTAGRPPGDRPRVAHFHTGGMPGVSSMIWRVPAEERCIVILGNTIQTATRRIRKGVSEILAGRDPGRVRARGDFEIARTVLEGGQERALEDLAKWPENVRENYIKRDVISISHSLLDQARVDEALRLTEFLTIAYDGDPHAYDAHAFALRRAGRLRESITYYEKVLEADPEADSMRSLIEHLEAEIARR